MKRQGKRDGRRGQRLAWTLVEMLLAVAIGGAVVSTAAAVAVQTFAARQAVRDTLERRWSRELVFQVFEQDVGARLRDLPADVRNVEPLIDDGGLVQVICLAHSPEATTNFPRMLPAQVAYRAVQGGDGRAVQLVREIKFLTDPPNSITRTAIGPLLASARVEFLAGQEWVEQFAVRDGEPAIRAVRLVCQWSEGGERATRTVVLDEAKDGESR